MENKTSENNSKMEMEFCVRVATHSILKELNSAAINRIWSKRLMGGSNDFPVDPIIWLVNGLWVDQRSSSKHSFKQLANDVYKAKSQSLDFKKAEQVADEINAWAREVSKGHIDNLVSSESLQALVLILASALYFQASWIDKYDIDLTEAENFPLLDGEHVRVPFIKQGYTRNFYGELRGFKLLKMGYEKAKDNKNYAMYIFLPDRYDELPELIQKIHSDPRLFTVNHELQYVNLHKLWLPKLKFEYGLDISLNIRELGLDLPFHENAELTEIVDSNDNVYVPKVIQKSYIEVNEEGTCAASITEIDYDMGYAPDDIPVRPIPSKIFVADHPFLFMIKEEVSGIVLFVGAFFNPLL